MNRFLKTIGEMRLYLILWFTQMLSGLGSAMTAFALVVWSYSFEGSALKTALLMVCSYTPYVLFSVFAGAISDKWNKKKILLASDTVSAVTTVIVLVLIKTDQLRLYHLYILNAVSGLMNTIQQPASEVVTTLILPKKHYQRVGSLRYLSSSLSSILTPILAAAVMGLFGMEWVIAFDLATFVIAFFVLLFFIDVPEESGKETKKESFFESARTGLDFLKREKGVFALMLFLAAINFVASMYNAAFPAMVLSKAGETEMGAVNAVVGITTLIGSVIASFMKTPKSRIKAIWLCLMASMCTENLFLALGRNVYVWSIGAFLGWIMIPLMNANLDAIMRLKIPREIQGRVFAARNSFQFFTIPLGYLMGGALVDHVFEPFMAAFGHNRVLQTLFMSGKGSGAKLFFFVLWLTGIFVCLAFRKNRYILKLEQDE
ncbi:MAG: MFS transporter [Clostridia bacterium]|nr:MFS transporter [Clostridia bacterium]